jgi:hypothetical protein
MLLRGSSKGESDWRGYLLDNAQISRKRAWGSLRFDGHFLLQPLGHLIGQINPF